MKIIFGHNLDGETWPDLTSGGAAVMDRTVCGPGRMLRLLETRLGLARRERSALERTESYRHAMEKLENNNHFYSASFAIDPLGTARRVLQIRDAIVASAAMVSLPKSVPSRMADIRKIEASWTDCIAFPGVPDRLRQIITETSQFDLVDLSVECVDPKELLDPPWDELLCALKKSGADLIFAKESDADAKASAKVGKRDLDLLRDALHSSKNSKLALQGDGSFVILRGSGELSLGEYLSHEAKSMINKTTKVVENGAVIIAAPEERSFGTIFRENGLATPALAMEAGLLPAPQVLPLSLALCWEPLDPYRLLEFLSLPITPLSRSLAVRLAGVVAANPGIGSERWQEALEQGLDRVAELARESESKKGTPAAAMESAAKGQRKKTAETLNFYIDRERFDPVMGIPSVTLLALLKKLKSWAAGKLAFIEKQKNEIDPGLSQLLAHTADLERILSGRGEAHIPRTELEKLLRDIRRSAAGSGAKGAEVGAIPCIGHPAALSSPVDSILWWNFVDSGPVSGPRESLSPEEIAILEKAGRPRDAGIRRARRQDLYARRIFLLAQKRLVLFIPDTIRGEVSGDHFIYSRIGALVENLESVEFRPERESKRNKLYKVPKMQPLSSVSLPAVEDEWTFKAGSIQLRENESHTSLDLMFFKPQEWLIRYAAKLSMGPLFAVANVSFVRGTVLHRLMETVFFRLHLQDETGGDATTLALKQGRIELQRIMYEEGAVLQMRGREAERMEVENAAEKSITNMMRFLRSSGWSVESMEEKLEGYLGSQAVRGYVDLILNRKGKKAVVDMKTSGAYKDILLRENRATQLALYASLLEEKNNSLGKESRGKRKLPVQAFFSLIDGAFISCDGDAFPDALIVSSEAGDSRELLQRMEFTLEYRQTQFRKGKVPIVFRENLGEHAKVHPEAAVPFPDRLFLDSDYEALLGGFSE